MLGHKPISVAAIGARAGIFAAQVLTTMDTWLRATYNAQATADTALRAEYAKNATADYWLKAAYLVQASIDARLTNRISTVCTIDCIFVPTGPDDIFGDQWF